MSEFRWDDNAHRFVEKTPQEIARDEEIFKIDDEIEQNGSYYAHTQRDIRAGFIEDLMVTLNFKGIIEKATNKVVIYK